MSDTRAVLSNVDARRFFLHKHALAEPPKGSGKGADLQGLIEQLGFVQIDSINIVERAHHMILWSRRTAYRPKNLVPLLEKDRSLFEHWTHDASVIPTAYYPYWRMRFSRYFNKMKDRRTKGKRVELEEQFDKVRAQIRETGACSSSDVGVGEKRNSGGWWDWHPSKAALENLWQIGELAVCKRVGFQKHYDLTERILPSEILDDTPSEADTIEWCCHAALDRLGFATSGEIAAFWATVTAAEAREWCASALKNGDIIEVDIEGHDGSIRRSFARADIFEQARSAPKPTARMRVLSPFDPALRDRKRAERLFGFSYRIEVFVPAPKRQYGYYVFPLLEGDRLVGRVDMKAHRDNGSLFVTAVWPEAKVKFGEARQKRLFSELDRVARFCGCDRVTYADGWLRAAKTG